MDNQNSTEFVNYISLREFEIEFLPAMVQKVSTSNQYGVETQSPSVDALLNPVGLVTHYLVIHSEAQNQAQHYYQELTSEQGLYEWRDSLPC